MVIPAIPFFIRNTIGYHSNTWSSCLLFNFKPYNAAERAISNSCSQLGLL